MHLFRRFFQVDLFIHDLPCMKVGPFREMKSSNLSRLNDILY